MPEQSIRERTHSYLPTSNTGTELDLFDELLSTRVVATKPSTKTSLPVSKFLCARFSFFFASTNDGSLGPFVPYMLRIYNTGTGSISIVYFTSVYTDDVPSTYAIYSCAASFSSWLLAAATDSHATRYRGTGTILAIGAFLQLLAQILRFWNPLFALFALTFFLAALRIACQDAYSNTFVTTVPSAHRWLGFIHAMYALGALVSPFVATAIVSSVQSRWSIFHVFLVGLGAVNLAAVVYSFKDSLKVHASHPGDNATSFGQNKAATRDMLQACKLNVVWLLSLFFFPSPGVGITLEVGELSTSFRSVMET
ncbi:Protein-serine/threonine phosphatase [Ascochyta lentis]